ncbi:MAG: hypothetical protein JSS18_11330 [Proteobacteria bacterium]|nr:hypothetical protein [Pseudomonadota bacterium]
MGKRDLKGGLPLCIGVGSPRPLPPLTAEQRAKWEAISKKLDAADAASPHFVNGEFVEPEDDPDGFDRRMTGV